MIKIHYIFLFVGCFLAVSGEELKIKKCSLSDANFNKCLQDRVQYLVPRLYAGRKDVGLIPYDPLYVEKVDLGKVGTFEQEYEHMYIYGFKDLTLSDANVNFDKENCFIKFSAHMPEVRFEADFKTVGKLIIFALNSKGKSNVTLTDFSVHHDYKCERRVKNNKTYIHLTSVKLHITKPKRNVFAFDKLIAANPELNDQIVKVFNENGDIIFSDMKPKFERAFEELFKALLNRVNSKLALEDIFDP